MSWTDAEHFKREASTYWNSFYRANQTQGYRDRHWLVREFPVLATPGLTVLEVSTLAALLSVAHA